MLGDFAVGKTSLVRRFVEGIFDDRYLSTIGVKISRRAVELPARPVTLLIWDLAGNEAFNGVQASYLQGAAGALLVCDLTRPTTFAALDGYAHRLRQVNERVELTIAANKADLESQRELDAVFFTADDHLAELAGELNAAWFITSARTGVGVEAAFAALAQRILDRS
jgi:small GTP-binding protein